MGAALLARNAQETFRKDCFWTRIYTAVIQSKCFEYIRKIFGDDLEICHDTHERIPPVEAVRLAKALEHFRLFFLEDLLSPENGDWFRVIRNQSSVPLAQGELFNNPKEFDYLITEKLIDFIRVHISQIGGLTPARKLAIFAERFGIRTAWHGPSDVSPVGHAANVHLSIASHNFGILEWTFPRGALCEVFSGYPEYENGYVYPNDKPGFGIDIDEELAQKYPCNNGVTHWTQTRLMDGAIQYP
jgi:mannonate dehydratase